MAPRENATPPYWSGALSVMVGLLLLTGEEQYTLVLQKPNEKLDKTLVSSRSSWAPS